MDEKPWYQLYSGEDYLDIHKAELTDEQSASRPGKPKADMRGNT